MRLCVLDFAAIVLIFIISFVQRHQASKLHQEKNPMNSYTNKIFIILFFVIFFTSLSFPQDVDIIPYLKMIESGKKTEAIRELLLLKNKNPNDPNVMFLEAILTEDGKESINIYNKILEKYPHSRYADASLYRIYSYYFSLGEYDKAKESFEKLKEEYPISPYLKLAERNIPSENKLFAEKNVKKEKSPQPEKKNEIKKEEKSFNYKFTIQAGAFSKASNAISLKKSFENNGFLSEVKEKNVGGTNFNIVYVGKFQNRDEAENFLQVINNEFKLEGRVVSIQ